MKTAKKHAGHGLSQYELTTEIVKNLSQFDITPTAKLVLLYLSTCYNPKNADVFPKQKTIAAKIGVSERSVTRAVQELFKAGLILIECKHTNRYKIVQNRGGFAREMKKNFNTDNLSESSSKNDIQKSDNLSETHVHHEQTMEHDNEPVKTLDFKILKEYAKKHGARNINAFVNYLKRTGNDVKIIADYKSKLSADRYYQRQREENERRIAELRALRENKKPLEEEFTRESAENLVKTLAGINRNLLDKGTPKRLIELFGLEI